MFNHTSTPWAPWYIIPADHKWFTRYAVVSIICHTLDRLNLAYPAVSADQKKALLAARESMERENDEVSSPATRNRKTKKKNRG
jgi:hypothetical protein